MITCAIQKYNNVYVYNKTDLLFFKSGELHGYTCSAVSIKKGNTIRTYDEKKKLISSIPAK